jgi:hypothetical protein
LVAKKTATGTTTAVVVPAKSVAIAKTTVQGMRKLAVVTIPTVGGKKTEFLMLRNTAIDVFLSIRIAKTAVAMTHREFLAASSTDLRMKTSAKAVEKKVAVTKTKAQAIH